MLLPVITQGGDVMPVLTATRQASYVSRSSVGKTCSTCHELKGSELDILLKMRDHKAFYMISRPFLCRGTYNRNKEKNPVSFFIRKYFFFSPISFSLCGNSPLPKHTKSKKQFVAISVREKTCCSSISRQVLHQPFDPLRQLTPTP